MIIARLFGGLGNQMFQYAAARRLAHVSNDELKLDITSFRDDRKRCYYMNPLNIIETIASDEEIQRLRNQRWIREPHFHFWPDVMHAGANFYLDGYWQSERYFRDVEPIIRGDFTMRRPPEGENARMTFQILNSESVAVHIRRGDYVSDLRTHQVHGVCSPEYYHQAMAMVAGWAGQPHFFLFSDDWGWVQQYFNTGFPRTVVSQNGSWPCEDLRLMSYCKYHIIANSTLSWWGAWLSNRPHKVVIAPRRWFAGADKYTGDLIPGHWIQI